MEEDFMDIVRLRERYAAPCYRNLAESIIGEQERMSKPAKSERQKREERAAALERWYSETEEEEIPIN